MDREPQQQQQLQEHDHPYLFSSAHSEYDVLRQTFRVYCRTDSDLLCAIPSCDETAGVVSCTTRYGKFLSQLTDFIDLESEG
jgi:hypothetical protein